MIPLKRIFTALLILLIVNLNLPNITFSNQGLSKHPLEIRTTPEEDIPMIKVKKIRLWPCCLGLGLAAVVGAAYFFLLPPEETGSITGTW